jgi:hypothetical protein
MNRNLPLIILVLLSFVVLSGCEPGSTTPPPSSYVDRSMTDYGFVDISDSCTLYDNVNLSSPSPCLPPKKEMFMYYTDDNNWSIMCCNYNSKCAKDNETTSDYSKICENDNSGKYTGYVFSDNGFWMAQCCNPNGGGCYVDLEINVTDDTTVCDEEYHQNTYSVDYNNETWSAMCCIGGIEE